MVPGDLLVSQRWLPQTARKKSRMALTLSLLLRTYSNANLKMFKRFSL
uniref:Uncharacterized protein n=1 Tax=Rhizophora mucronata TaxID=61149 RepID=A0A2P2L6K6_RHIMU